eukprot:TRINITY_DN49332_c0_g1_i1.p1 TRINITY_DN49332_c0_g1~~TRINITY_DN49332_c0_g1_i1.p1  ORF type:complete len:218 (-),score=8.57 TRINITY_DN49332_c0_g1_i1:275-892(-)
MARLLISVATFGAACHLCSSFPGYVSRCRPWLAGERGYMGVQSLLDGRERGDCKISVDPSSASSMGREAYTVTVSSGQPMLFKLYSTDGQCLGEDLSFDSFATFKTFVWEASTDAAEIYFHALCANKYIDMYAAAPLRHVSHTKFHVTKVGGVNGSVMSESTAELLPKNLSLRGSVSVKSAETALALTKYSGDQGSAFVANFSKP